MRATKAIYIPKQRYLNSFFDGATDRHYYGDLLLCVQTVLVGHVLRDPGRRDHRELVVREQREVAVQQAYRQHRG